MALASEGDPIEPLDDSFEAMIKPRPWLERFIAWKTLIKNGCAASGGRGIFCFWLGRNCSFVECPRRNFEEDELITESVLKIKKQAERVKNLRAQITEKNAQIKKLKQA